MAEAATASDHTLPRSPPLPSPPQQEEKEQYRPPIHQHPPSHPVDDDHYTHPQQQQQAAPAAAAVEEHPKPWLLYTAAQAQQLKRTVVESTDTALQTARTHLGDLQSASSDHLLWAQDVARRVSVQYGEYEDLFFGKLKEGLRTVGYYPVLSSGVAAGLGLLLMRRPRRFLFRNTIGRFQSEESLLANYEKKVKDMRQSVDLLKNESKKLEERARLAEEELQRGQTKLKHAGSQLRNLSSSVYKTEDQARGLMDGLRELPGRDALRLRADVASMAAEAKQQRNNLNKKVTKIANYGIPV